MSLWCTAELARQNTCIEAAIHVTETDQQYSETSGFVTVTDCHRDMRRIGISRWLYCNRKLTSIQYKGWLGGATVLGKLPVPGHPTNLDYSRARAYCACRRCGWGLFVHFSHMYHFSFLFPSLWETARYRLKYCLKGPLSLKQPTKQPLQCITVMFHQDHPNSKEP